MTDKRNCKLTLHEARIFIYYGTSASPQSVCILGHDFPGRSGAIRVDTSPPVQTDRDGCAPGRLAAAIAAGSMVTTRRVEFPYDYNADQTSSTAGAKAAMELVAFIRAKVDRISF
jgi:hypothetical protein